jgi:ABC-type branched-subunit amino acid transport system ATPase component
VAEGLAPLIRNEIWPGLKHLKAEGQAILLVDKHVDALLKFADRHVVIEKGATVWTGTSAELGGGCVGAAAVFAGVRVLLRRSSRVTTEIAIGSSR